MKNKIKMVKILVSMLLVVGVFFSPMKAPTKVYAEESSSELVCTDEEGVGGFVARLYNVALGRDYDVAGYNDWCQKLITGEMTGGRVAFGFIFSPEFVNKNLSNEEYVNTLYSVFFNRSADEAGFNNWVSQLNSGVSRESVMDGFVNSTEWANVCISFGILSGGGATASVIPDATEETIGFVTRLYELCLGRSPDAAGLEHWCYVLTSQEQTAKEVAFGFIFSDEFEAIYEEMTEYERIELFYNVFLNRQPDENYSNWGDAAIINNYEGRRQLFMGFADSDEFRNICASYRVICGDSLNLMPLSDMMINELFNDVQTGRYDEYVDMPASETPTYFTEINGQEISEYYVEGYGTVYGYFVSTSELTRLTNQYRRSLGLPIFDKPTREQQEIANIRAIESAVMGISHTRPNGESNHLLCNGENTTGYTNAIDAFNAYMASDGHRKPFEIGYTSMATATFIRCEWYAADGMHGGYWGGNYTCDGANVMCFWL